MLTTLALVASLALADPVVIEPFSDGPLRVETVSPGVARVYNDTQAYVSIEIRTLDSPGAIIQPHAKSIFDPMDKSIVGPQSGPSGLYIANTVDLALNGKNTRITMLTPGVSGYTVLTDAEDAVVDRMWKRSMTDQVVLPFVTSISGLPLTDKKKLALVQAAVGTFLSQNHQLYDQWKTSNGAMDYFRLVYNAIMRDVDSGGPLTTGIYKATGMKFGEKVAEWVAKRTVLRHIPYANLADFALQAWNWGPTVNGIINYIHDTRTLPAKLTFSAYYRPGASLLEPDGLRTDGRDKTILVHGYRLQDSRFPHLLTLKRKDGSTFFSSSEGVASPDGKTLEFKIPGSYLTTEKGYLEPFLKLGEKLIEFPEYIYLTNVISVEAIVPSSGRPGQRVSLIGTGMHPFESTNKVFFVNGSQRLEAKLFINGEERIECEVPDLPSSIEVWDVVVEESRPGSTRDSDPVKFTRLEGTHEEAEQVRDATMTPERTWTMDGTLTDAKPSARYTLQVPAGMEIRVELLDVSGGKLKELNLWIRKNRRGAEAVRSSVGKIENIDRVFGALKPILHTTSSSFGANTYYVHFDKGTGGDVTYKARARYVRRGDGGGEDASDFAEQAMPLAVGERINAHLHGAPGVWHEDGKDYYLISSIPQSQRLTLKVGGVEGTDGEAASLGYIAVHRRRNGTWELNGFKSNITRADNSITLFQDDVEVRDCLIEVKHGSGRPKYWLEADVDHIAGPGLDRTPIMSTFDEGTNDNWVITGNFSARPTPAVWQSTASGGYIKSRDGGATKGPLDLVFVIDTTGSMRSVINQVTTSAKRIVDGVRARSTSLKVGVVGFKDYASDGAGALTKADLSLEVDGRLRTLSSWPVSGGGGDGPEDMLYGLDEALKLSWRERDSQNRPVAKVVVLMTDQPAKLSGSVDFAGRSLSSVGGAFNRAGVRIFPVLTSEDATAASQARTLARLTGGESHSERNVELITGIITDLVDGAMEAISPRYYTSPVKFSGDQSRFYGRGLTFSLRSSSGEFRVNEPDIVLYGAGRKIMMTTFPTPEVSGNTDGFNKISVLLRESSNWYSSPNNRASASDIKTVLANLQSIQIRGEYFSGEDESALDRVILGDSTAITDRGLTPFAEEILRSMDQTLGLMLRLERAFDGNYRNALVILRAELVRQGAKDPTGIATLYNGQVSSAFYGALEGYPNRKFFTEELVQMRANMNRIRLKGDLTAEEASALLEGERKWVAAFGKIDDAMKALVVQVAKKQTNQEIFFGGGSSIDAAQAARTRMQEADDRIRELRREIKDEASQKRIYVLPSS